MSSTLTLSKPFLLVSLSERLYADFAPELLADAFGQHVTVPVAERQPNYAEININRRFLPGWRSEPALAITRSILSP